MSGKYNKTPPSSGELLQDQAPLAQGRNYESSDTEASYKEFFEQLNAHHESTARCLRATSELITTDIFVGNSNLFVFLNVNL